MSEAMTIPPLAGAPAKRVPTVYFIDDSATMREVIKIAFRRENIQVITCADAASALEQFEQTRPDVVITDVIMPDQDGYSVCSQIKENPDLSATPVLLMSGVVNKSVADKAVSVKADELIRKPFQPQELINRVKALLEPKTVAAPSLDRSAGTSALNGLFASAPATARASRCTTTPGHAFPASAFCVGSAETARGDRQAGDARQEAADRTPNRTPVQPGAGSSDPDSRANGIVLITACVVWLLANFAAIIHMRSDTSRSVGEA